MWHWRVMKSLAKDWIVVSKSAPQKLVNFFPADKRLEFSNFIGLFSLKGKLLEPNFLQDFDLGTLKGHQKFGQKLNCGFQTSSPNIGECLSSRREGSNFQILFVLSKRQIAWTKNFHRCSILWPWKVRAKTESLFPSQPPKMNFFPLGKKRRIFKFYWFVLSKR